MIIGAAIVTCAIRAAGLLAREMRTLLIGGI